MGPALLVVGVLLLFDDGVGVKLYLVRNRVRGLLSGRCGLGFSSVSLVLEASCSDIRRGGEGVRDRRIQVLLHLPGVLLRS